MVLDIIPGINSATSIIMITFPQQQFKGTAKRWFSLKVVIIFINKEFNVLKLATDFFCHFSLRK